MRKPPGALFIFLGLAACPLARADVDAGLRVGDDGIKEFHLAIGKHYGVAESEILLVRKRNLRDEDLPVVFHLAAQARVKPAVIVDLRLGGKSWMEITTHFGLTAGVFHVPVTREYGPPYGKAYGYFRKKKRAEWGTIVLTDEEVVHLASLRFLAAHHGQSADAIIGMRQKGEGLIRLHTRVKAHKVASAKRKAKTADRGRGKKTPSARQSAPRALKHSPRVGSKGNGGGKGKGKGKGKGRGK